MARRRKRNSEAKREGADLLGGDERRALLTYIKGILASLNPTDRLIGERVLADPEKVITSSIGELREACGASVGAIVGFCRRLGLEGFSDFKIALARDLAQSGLPGGLDPRVRGDGDEASLMEKVFQVHSQSLVETLQINPAANLERVAQAMEKARMIELFSIGLSYPVAYTAYCKFHLLGLPASAQFDSHIQLIAATHMKKGDVAVGISLSGATRETVQCLEVAKANGATTICLTNAMKSPITEQSDFCLYATPSEILYFQAPLASRVTQLALIDALFVTLAQKHKNKTAGRLRHSGEELLKRRLK
jgi:RpiR family transcriptional regulator, carbohydrate utilization regulator